MIDYKEGVEDLASEGKYCKTENADLKEGSMQHYAREGIICGCGIWSQLRPLKKFWCFHRLIFI